MLVLVCGYFFAWQSAREVVVALLGVSSAAALIAGVVVNRPRQRGPWLMLAGAVLAVASSRIVFVELGLQPYAFHQGGNRLVPVYTLHLVAGILIIGALVWLTWPHVDMRRLPALIDAGIVILGAELVAWVVIARPWRTITSLPTAEAASMAYVLRDVLILAALARLATAVRWSGSVGWLAFGTMGLLTYDILFRVDLIGPNWLWGSPTEVGWLALFVGLGAAALEPSMSTLNTRVQGNPDEGSTLPLALVAMSAVLPFGLLLAPGIVRPGIQAAPNDLVPIAAASDRDARVSRHAANPGSRPA